MTWSGEQGSAVHQDDVASHSESRPDCARLTACANAGPLASVSRTYDAFVGLHDGAIHARCETKIVSVDDQSAHGASLRDVRKDAA